MSRELIYNFLTIMWSLIICLFIYTSITDYKKYRKLGELISKNQKKISQYQTNGIMFTILFVLSLPSLINQNYSYSMVNSIGLFIVALKFLIMGIRAPRIYEKGVIIGDAIINLDNIFVFSWSETKNPNMIELQFRASFMRLVVRQENMLVKILVLKSEKDKIHRLLELNNIEFK